MDAALDTLLRLNRTTIQLVREVDRALGSVHGLGLNDLADGPLGAIGYSGPQGRPLLVLISFLMAEDPVKAMLDDAKSITSTGGDTLHYVPQVGPTLTLTIDPATPDAAFDTLSSMLAIGQGTAVFRSDAPLTL